MANIKKKSTKINNLVAKNAGKFNKYSVHCDKKKASKRGKRKHKSGDENE